MAIVNGLDTEKLLSVVETIKQNWEAGKTVWKEDLLPGVKVAGAMNLITLATKARCTLSF